MLGDRSVVFCVAGLNRDRRGWSRGGVEDDGTTDRPRRPPDERLFTMGVVGHSPSALPPG